MVVENKQEEAGGVKICCYPIDGSGIRNRKKGKKPRIKFLFLFKCEIQELKEPKRIQKCNLFTFCHEKIKSHRPVL